MLSDTGGLGAFHFTAVEAVDGLGDPQIPG